MEEIRRTVHEIQSDIKKHEQALAQEIHQILESVGRVSSIPQKIDVLVKDVEKCLEFINGNGKLGAKTRLQQLEDRAKTTSFWSTTIVVSMITASITVVGSLIVWIIERSK